MFTAKPRTKADPNPKKELSLVELCRNKKLKCCTVDKTGNLKLKINHEYYYQVQGQLHITGMEKCLFGLWKLWEDGRQEIDVQEIYRNDKFWKEKMEPKLKEFYMKRMLPIILSKERNTV